MPGEYAAKTEVPVTRSREEIEKTLTRFGASEFGYMQQGSQVAIVFTIKGIRVLMRMALPDRTLFEHDKRGYLRTDTAIQRDWEQACRQRWRTLAAAIKAKLAMVDDGISTIEQEFLANIVLPDGGTVGDQLLPEIREIAKTGTFPPLMPGMAPPATIVALGSGK